jgi:hypothetical protein
MSPMEAIPPEALLAAYPEPMRDIAESLRDIVRRAVPDAIERVRPGWRLIGYDTPRGRGRSTYFCYVAPEPAHVHLGFEYGVFMPDPDGLLEGAGVTRRVRWVTLREPNGIPGAQLEQLVMEGLRVALVSPAERFGRPLELG